MEALKDILSVDNEILMDNLYFQEQEFLLKHYLTILKKE